MKKQFSVHCYDRGFLHPIPCDDIEKLFDYFYLSPSHLSSLGIGSNHASQFPDCPSSFCLILLSEKRKN